jgi:hypothetical protein
MKQKLNALMMKMNQFFLAWDQMEDLNKYSEYDVARKMITVIERENKKKKVLYIVKDNNEPPKNAG